AMSKSNSGSQPRHQQQQQHRASIPAYAGALHSGPNGTRPHRIAVDPDAGRYVGDWRWWGGDGGGCGQHTSSLAGLGKSTRGAFVPRPRSSMPGEVGWVPAAFGPKPVPPPPRGHQVAMSEFWADLEHRYSYRYLGAWWPDPNQGQGLASSVSGSGSRDENSSGYFNAGQRDDAASPVSSGGK
ncbi:hypothetical protein BOX15_Mlig034204g4, partial [Macrostomum lignano]